MKKIATTKTNKYFDLIENIGKLLEEGRKQAYHTFNSILVKTYREIGRQVIEFEQKKPHTHGHKLFENIATDLKTRHGKGFSRSNVIYTQLFYLKYPKNQTLSDQLSWSHYAKLLLTILAIGLNTRRYYYLPNDRKIYHLERAHDVY